MTDFNGKGKGSPDFNNQSPPPEDPSALCRGSSSFSSRLTAATVDGGCVMPSWEPGVFTMTIGGSMREQALASMKRRCERMVRQGKVVAGLLDSAVKREVPSEHRLGWVCAKSGMTKDRAEYTLLLWTTNERLIRLTKDPLPLEGLTLAEAEICAGMRDPDGEPRKEWDGRLQSQRDIDAARRFFASMSDETRRLMTEDERWFACVSSACNGCAGRADGGAA